MVLSPFLLASPLYATSNQWTMPCFPLTRAVWTALGSDPNLPIYVAIKGIVFDVSRNSAYHQGGSYRGMFTSILPLFFLSCPPKLNENKSLLARTRQGLLPNHHSTRTIAGLSGPTWTTVKRRCLRIGVLFLANGTISSARCRMRLIYSTWLLSRHGRMGYEMVWITITIYMRSIAPYMISHE